MRSKIILDSKKIAFTIERLCYQLIETHKDFLNTALIGLQPRGIYLAKRIHSKLEEILQGQKVTYGVLDTTFYRDDFRRQDRVLTPDSTTIDFAIEEKSIVLIDDVLFTGRTIRSALDAMLDYGRPADVELLVLVDRRLHRHLPIQAKYVGKVIDSVVSERVNVVWEDMEGAKDVVQIIPGDSKAQD